MWWLVATTGVALFHALRAAMRRNVPSRPGNIRPGERGLN